MLIEDGGRLYNINEETGLVTQATVADTEIEGLDEEFRLGDRVEVVGSAGKIVSMIPSYYGVAFGVQFDDGDFDEFLENELKRSKAEKPVYSSPLDEVLARYSTYRELPIYTNDEIDAKEAEARWLKLQASTLVSDKSFALGDQNRLGEVILTTTSDLKDFDSLRVSTEDSKTYLSKFNQYKLADEVGSYGASMGGRDDASWLDTASEGMEVTETNDIDLAARASEVVSALTASQLNDDEFMQVAGSYQYSYLQMTDEQKKTFDKFLTQARAERLKELPKETKTASTYDLDDASDIFI